MGNAIRYVTIGLACFECAGCDSGHSLEMLLHVINKHEQTFAGGIICIRTRTLRHADVILAQRPNG